MEREQMWIVDDFQLWTCQVLSVYVHAQYNELQEKDVQNAMCSIQCNLQLNTRGMQLIS